MFITEADYQERCKELAERLAKEISPNGTFKLEKQVRVWLKFYANGLESWSIPANTFKEMWNTLWNMRDFLEFYVAIQREDKKDA